jgi:hypothetical protein
LDLVRGIDAQRLLLIGIGAEATWVVVTAQPSLSTCYEPTRPDELSGHVAHKGPDHCHGRARASRRHEP